MERKTKLKVKLIGEDGNVYYLLGKAQQVLKRAGYDKDFINEFIKEATSGDYNHAIATIDNYMEII